MSLAVAGLLIGAGLVPLGVLAMEGSSWRAGWLTVKVGLGLAFVSLGVLLLLWR